ncbi:MAG TPA: DUF1707 domain-containing protein [Propionibacteriaceae bacterium]|nr:DUF1707 domain-containing protein [Propionibacteriaceae bacterium]
MSDLPISSPYRSTPDASVSDDERNRVSSQLNAAFTEGTIDSDDYHARLDRLFAAQRLGELVPVVEGLPPLQTYQNPSIISTGGGEPGHLAEAKTGTRLTVVTVGVLAGVILVIALLLVVLI